MSGTSPESAGGWSSNVGVRTSTGLSSGSLKLGTSYSATHACRELRYDIYIQTAVHRSPLLARMGDASCSTAKHLCMLATTPSGRRQSDGQGSVSACDGRFQNNAQGDQARLKTNASSSRPSSQTSQPPPSASTHDRRIALIDAIPGPPQACTWLHGVKLAARSGASPSLSRLMPTHRASQGGQVPSRFYLHTAHSRRAREK